MYCSEKENAINEVIAGICSEFNNDPNELIAILHKAQGHFGFLPSEVQQAIAEHLNIPIAKVFGVVTFYSYFTMEPKGKFLITIYMGAACYVRGAEKVLHEFEKRL
ncbi:MAG: NAD(P)H-dependent oxidoreductase subunit E, partial [Candidatus Riflebacteria bacterium]|nr:NAD(P)H-dependent oxidoreductase subunit E [Candidatus Riflebacteria bacterium]